MSSKSRKKFQEEQKKRKARKQELKKKQNQKTKSKTKIKTKTSKISKTRGLIREKYSINSNEAQSVVEKQFMNWVVLTLVGANNLPISNSYCIFYPPNSTRFKSRIIFDNSDPIWNETFYLGFSAFPQKLQFEIWDRQESKDAKIGQSIIELEKITLDKIQTKNFDIPELNASVTFQILTKKYQAMRSKENVKNLVQSVLKENALLEESMNLGDIPKSYSKTDPNIHSYKIEKLTKQNQNQNENENQKLNSILKTNKPKKKSEAQSEYTNSEESDHKHSQKFSSDLSSKNDFLNRIEELKRKYTKKNQNENENSLNSQMKKLEIKQEIKFGIEEEKIDTDSKSPIETRNRSRTQIGKGIRPLFRSQTKTPTIIQSNFENGENENFLENKSEFTFNSDDDKSDSNFKTSIHNNLESDLSLQKCSSKLELEFVYGYKGTETRNNIHYNENGEIVYFTAKIGIVHNITNNTQRFFLAHSSQISCNAIHPNKSYIATGQDGENPLICIWDSVNIKLLSKFHVEDSKGVSGLSFSSDGKWLFICCYSESYPISVWDWENKEMLAKSSTNEQKVLCIESNPIDPSSFVSCGISHIKFWKFTENNKNLSFKEGEFSEKQKTMLLSLVITKSNKALTGTKNGEVYMWDCSSYSLEKSFRAHTGLLLSICTTDSSTFFTGGKDGKIIIWDEKEFQPISKIDSLVIGQLRSLKHNENGKLITGSNKNQIWEVDLSTNIAKPIMISHGDEVWGIATHPKRQEFVSVGDDRTMLCWSGFTHEMLTKMTINGQPRSVTYSPNGEMIAIGLRDGGFVVVDSDLKPIANRKDITSLLTAMKFSSDSQSLVIGFSDGIIANYRSQSRFRKSWQTKISGAVSAFDWSINSDEVRATDGKQTTVFLNDRGKVSSQNYTQINWFTDECEIVEKLHREKHFDSTMCCLVATNNVTPQLKVYSYPLVNPDKFQVYLGHSSDIPSVRCLSDSHVISVGGADMSIFQWKIIRNF